MSNTEATITNIKAQLSARGWEVSETILDDNSPYDCHLVCTSPDGERTGCGPLPRATCWTEAYEKITGQSWNNSISQADHTDNVSYLGLARSAKYQKEALSGAVMPAMVTPKKHHLRWINDQIDRQKRGLPSAIDRFGKPKASCWLSIPWVCQMLLDEAIEARIKK